MADKLTGSEADALVAEAKNRLAMCVKHEGEERQEALDDFRFFAGEQWPSDMRSLRQVERRPCLTINKLPAFVHQVINDQRQNRPSIKVHPVDSGADVKTADVLQGLIKYIEYNSNADVAYDTAVSHATIGGRGFFRLGTDYTDETSFDQDIKFRRVQNPFTVYIDPFSTEPDGSDMMFCFVSDIISREEFKAQYPDAKTLSAEALAVGAGDAGLLWLSDEQVRVAEYYKVKTSPATLVRLTDGRDVFSDEMQPGDEVMTRADGKPMERQSEKRSVCWYKVTTTEILEETEIPCRWIPVFPVYGDEQIVDGKIRRNGMVRFAKDPQRMYNFWMTSATEEVSLRPKTPFIGAVGQFDTAKKDWKAANLKSFAYLEYDPITVDGIQAPPPQRQPMADVPTGVLQMAMHASDNIKATTGIFDASLGAQGNETSGRAITARQREGDTANFHFGDNRDRTVRHAARCIVNMIPKVYDTQRIVRVLGEDQSMDMAHVNAPNVEQKPDEDGAIKSVLNDLTIGRYDVTLGSGPSYATKRAEAVDAMMQVGQSYPQLWQIAGDKMIRAMDWPEADEIADRVAKTIPPQLLEDDKEKGQQPPLPPQVIDTLQHAQQEIQQLHQALQEAQSGVAAKQVDNQAKLQIAQMQNQVAAVQAQMQQETERARIDSAERIAAMNNDTKHEIAELQGLIQMLLQKMTPPAALAGDVAQDFAQEKKDEPQTPDAVAIMAQFVKAMNPPKKKTMQIMAPSGQVYQGSVMEEPQEASDGGV